MALFSLEILLNTIVMEDFKYSYFFWLDIIATVSLVFDINMILDFFYVQVGSGSPSWESVNAKPDLETSSGDSDKIKDLLKSLRLIRLIRIIKLYKYVLKSKSQDEEEVPQKKIKKKSQVEVKKEEVPEEEMSLFMKETDPKKLGKSLSDVLNR